MFAGCRAEIYPERIYLGESDADSFIDDFWANICLSIGSYSFSGHMNSDWLIGIVAQGHQVEVRRYRVIKQNNRRHANTNGHKLW